MKNRFMQGLLALFSSLSLLSGCGPTAEEQRKMEEMEATIQTYRKKELEESEKIKGLSFKQKIFRDQIMLNMTVGSTSSPNPTDDTQWETDPLWNSGDKTQSLYALVYISPSIIDTAVDLWAVNRTDITDQIREQTRLQLQDQFIRTGEKAFLLLIKPIAGKDWHDWWRLHIGDLAENTTITTLNGKIGRLIRYESSLPQELNIDSGTVTCLFYLQDVVDEEKEPVFNVSISNLFYYIRPNTRKANIRPDSNKYSSTTNWIRSTQALRVSFQFETNKVHVLKMVQANIPFENIQSQYISPSRVILTSKMADTFVDVLVNLAASWFMKAAFKL